LPLGRHRRTHESQQDGQPQHQPLSDEDLENEENEFGSLDEDSPAPESHTFVPHGVVTMGAVTSIPESMTLQTSMPTMVAPHLITPQFLQQRI
jgi:transcription factor STE12